MFGIANAGVRKFRNWNIDFIMPFYFKANAKLLKNIKFLIKEPS